jgi:hypothetical protein
MQLTRLGPKLNTHSQVGGGKDGFTHVSKNEILNYVNGLDYVYIGPVVAPLPPSDCGNDEIFAEIKLKTDDHAAETFSALTRSGGSTVNTGSNKAGNNRAYVSSRCVPANDCYTCCGTEQSHQARFTRLHFLLSFMLP